MSLCQPWCGLVGDQNELYMVRQAKLGSFLRGESPRGVRPNQPPVSSVALATGNRASEVYTENDVGRKENRTLLKQSSLVKIWLQ